MPSRRSWKVRGLMAGSTKTSRFEDTDGQAALGERPYLQSEEKIYLRLFNCGAGSYETGSRKCSGGKDDCTRVGQRWKKQCLPGFTLVEMLMVVAIILTIAAIAIPNLARALNTARVARAVAEINTLEKDILAYEVTNGAPPNTLSDVGRASLLDPWGTPYQYVNYANPGSGVIRKDRFLHPINSTYDLYSKGADKKSVAPVTAGPSQDDVIRANDGAYVGLGSDY